MFGGGCVCDVIKFLIKKQNKKRPFKVVEKSVNVVSCMTPEQAESQHSYYIGATERWMS